MLTGTIGTVRFRDFAVRSLAHSLVRSFARSLYSFAPSLLRSVTRSFWNHGRCHFGTLGCYSGGPEAIGTPQRTLVGIMNPVMLLFHTQ